MKRITLSTLAVLVVTASAFTFRNGNTGQEMSASQASNGAFRDGLYLGKLTGQSGDKYRIAVGRWSKTEDRTSFAAGYDQGYRTQAVLQASK
jgi:hypothetical protein